MVSDFGVQQVIVWKFLGQHYRL